VRILNKKQYVKVHLCIFMIKLGIGTLHKNGTIKKPQISKLFLSFFLYS